jgi:hypothetical protein
MIRIYSDLEGIYLKFEEKFPHFRDLKNIGLYYTKFPVKLLDDLQGLIIRQYYSAYHLYSLCQLLSQLIPSKPIAIYPEADEEWTEYLLLEELDKKLLKLSSNFPRFMDFLAWLYIKILNTEDRIDFNDLLQKYGIGYKLDEVEEDFYEWNRLEKTDYELYVLDKIKHVEKEASDTSKQIIQHLYSTRKNLIKAINNREIKNALRDALSALEAYLKQTTNTTEIKNSVKEFENKDILKKSIVRYALKIWHDCHILYPDLRHGTSDAHESSITKEEALFWIGEIMNYILLIENVFKNN